jgi:hypothetical protein
MERGKQSKTKTFRNDLNRHGLHTGGQNDRGGDGSAVADDVRSEPRTLHHAPAKTLAGKSECQDCVGAQDKAGGQI